MCVRKWVSRGVYELVNKRVRECLTELVLVQSILLKSALTHMCSHCSIPAVHSSNRDKLVRIMYHALPVRRHSVGYRVVVW